MKIYVPLVKDQNEDEEGGEGERGYGEMGGAGHAYDRGRSRIVKEGPLRILAPERTYLARGTS